MSDLNECHVCGKTIRGEWDSQVYLGMETGELSKSGIHRWLIYDKHIKCSPSRAQRIIHRKYPRVFDSRERFDIRLWDEDERNRWVKIYTEAWVRLQIEYNPKWKNNYARHEKN